MSRPAPTHVSLHPPRAGAWRGWWTAWYAFRRRTRLAVPSVSMPTLRHAGITWHNVIVCLLPVYAWHALGRRRYARIAALLYASGGLLTIAGLGLAVGGLGLGLMFSLHGLGVAEFFYSGKMRPLTDHRAVRYAGVMLLTAVLYVGVSQRLLSYVAVPVKVNGRVVLINPHRDPAALARGDWCAFRQHSWREGNVMVPEGVFAGVVDALPGDRVEFRGKEFLVNGHALPRQVSMPTGGQLTVPANHLFIWPANLRLDITANDTALSLARNVAVVPVDAVVGRPHRWWFFRDQRAPAPRATPASAPRP